MQSIKVNYVQYTDPDARVARHDYHDAFMATLPINKYGAHFDIIPPGVINRIDRVKIRYLDSVPSWCIGDYVCFDGGCVEYGSDIDAKISKSSFCKYFMLDVTYEKVTYRIPFKLNIEKEKKSSGAD